ncbi:hypothetical protein CSB93_1141 [Pseudomonas paraeruginosa]|uniref:Uncharacterized protein n=1 Tax=Pseudomonas paraeruginosa TaxID=2994495 RepID=A0A2R3J285_9PSED|nr:hypothetical protein CSB93_1141 [Pseudomonas paraeruginosa]AWE89546.1 hypothetical protein CSC28_6457 [Pseudomonas paraeruginosa]PTC33430.1 hypothetical protein CLJ1_6097 [Pseudomonas aeruginosa]
MAGLAGRGRRAGRGSLNSRQKKPRASYGEGEVRGSSPDR